MARDLPDRRSRLFGRERDLAALLDRVRFKGLTAVVARPQMGKSWLLTELARRLATEHEPRHLVGFAESFGVTPDLLLRAVVDLYQRWLADAGYWQQAKRVWDKEKPNLLPGVGKLLAKLLKDLPGAGAIEEALNQLVAANQTLTSGGIQLPTITYEQARDLVRAVAEIGKRPVALVLDQWEMSPDVRLEGKTLDVFLHRRDEWPACHIFMALRPDEPAFGEVEALVKGLSGPAEILELEEMDLGAGEAQRLTGYVRGLVPAALDESEADLLRLVDGFPGVLYRWTDEDLRQSIASLDDLALVAADAHAYSLARHPPSDELKSLTKSSELRAGIRPDSVEGPDDSLGVRIDAAAFARLIADSAVEPPLAIGVFGEWGSGKSFFMRLMREEIRNLASQKNPAFCRQIVQIEFNAWHYVEANLWASLIDHILTKLDQHLGSKPGEVERIFAGLETARLLREQAEADRVEAEANRRRLAEELARKRREVERSISFKLLLNREFWRGMQYELLPEQARAKIDAFREREDVKSLVGSGRELWQLVNETRSLYGQARAFVRAARGLSGGKLVLAGGLTACTLGLLALLSTVEVESWQGWFIQVATQLSIAVIAVVGTWRWALGKAREALAIAEHLRDRLSSQNEAELESVRQELREVEQRVAEASARITRAEALLERGAVPRRIALFIEERIAAGEYQKHLGIVAMVRRDFEALSNLLLAEYSDRSANTPASVPTVERIVLYIDDLDRCPTQKVVQVLEAIHLLLAFRLFVVVVGLDVRWASRSLLDYYPRHLSSEAAGNPTHLTGERLGRNSFAAPHDYLEKIFQIPFWLRPLEPQSSREFLAALMTASQASGASETDFAAAASPGNSMASADLSSDEGKPMEFGALRNSVSGSAERPLEQGAARALATPPEPITFDVLERDFLLTLAACVGTSPRRVKRFVNIYRIIKATCPPEERSRFIVQGGASGTYRAALTLLALTTGAPHLASMVFARIMRARDQTVAALCAELEQTGAAFDPVEVGAAIDALRRYDEAEGGSATIDDLRHWQPRIGRFSFRLGDSDVV